MPDDGSGATPDAGQSDSGNRTTGNIISTGSQTQSTGSGPDQQGGAGSGDLGDAGKKALDAEREARKAAEARAKDLEAKVKKYDDEKLSETERLTNAATESEKAKLQAVQDLADERFSRKVERAAHRYGFLDAEDAVHLLDRSSVKTDDGGFPDADSLEKALKRLAEAKPHLVGGSANGSGDGGARRTAPAGESMNTLIRGAAGR